MLYENGEIETGNTHLTVTSISLHNAVPVCIVLRAEVCINHVVYAVNAQARFLAELFIVQALTIDCLFVCVLVVCVFVCLIVCLFDCFFVCSPWPLRSCRDRI